MSQKTKSSGSGVRGLILVSALALLLGGLISGAWAKDLPTGYPDKSPFGLPPPGPLPPPKLDPWCRYPVRDQIPAENKAALRSLRVVTIDEVEPNEDASTAQLLPIDTTIGNEVDVTVKGSILEGTDEDFYRIFMNKGDVIGLAVTTNRQLYDFRPDLGLDPVSAICDLTGDVIAENDDDGGISSLYPKSSPLPRIETPLYPFYRWDSVLSWIAPETGDYLIRVTSFESSRRGNYELKVVARRPGIETQPVGGTQILFLDFDGVEDFNAVETFGYGWYLTTLSPMRDFLFYWGLTLEDETAVVDATVAAFQERFDKIRSAALNGDRDIDDIDGHLDFEVRNSRDHADPWGQPNATRIIIGGSMWELGIATLGIAQSIDPGNFDNSETAVVLLDYLSDPDPANLDSINAIPRATGFTMVEAVGRVVGIIAAHEAVHTLGLWHTDNSNPIQCLIDSGGDGIANEAGVGPDGIMGTVDDELLELVPDEYDPFEGVGMGIEFTDTRIAFGMATGKQGDGPLPPPVDTSAKVSISAMPKVGVAPLSVNFAGGGIDPAGGQFIVFNWNFGDQATGAGAFVTHTYTKPGTYIVTLSGTTTNAATAQAATEVVVLSEPNELPVARIIASPTKGDAPLLVLFQADAEDPDGEIIGYAWDFGDGQAGTGQVIDHVFVVPGVYVVTLTVTDNIGAAQRVTKLITVLGASAGGLNTDDTQGGSGFPIPGLNGCGAGATSGLLATMAGLMGMALMRRRH